ncbi:MAG: hypothetical protein HY746_06585 [Elusimicrobia bacterium]|nr:hypothetical protein [Elusimicrobiota bacterium]
MIPERTKSGPGQFLSRWGISILLSTVLVAVILAVTRIIRYSRDSGSGIGSDNISGGVEQADRRLEELRQIIENNPEDMEAFLESGLLKLKGGAAFYVDAIVDLERARELGSLDIKIFEHLGIMYQAVGLYEFAEKEYKRFLANNPDDFETRMSLAKLYYKSEKFKEAENEYEKIRQKRPNHLVVLENTALTRWKNRRNWEEIVSAMRKEGQTGNLRADYIEGKINYEEKIFSGAIVYLEKVSQNAREDGFFDMREVYKMLIDSYLKLKVNDLAVKNLQELLKIDPADDEARSQLVRLTAPKSRKTSKK